MKETYVTIDCFLWTLYSCKCIRHHILYSFILIFSLLNFCLMSIPDLSQRCIIFIQLNAMILFTRGQFWPSGIVVACVCVCVCLSVCLSVCQSLACPDDNSGPVQARIAKFAPKMQKTLVKVPIVLGGNWPWPSRSNLTSKSEFTPFWACMDHYSPPILVRISKFGQQMHFSTVKIPVNLGLDWPWTWPSFLIPKFFFHCGGVHWDCETVPGLFQCCSGTVSQSLHQCTWGMHSQSGMGPLML